MGKLVWKAILACICAFLLLVAAAFYFRMEKERAVNHYVQTSYSQKYSIEYVGGYLPDDTQTYAVRLNDTDKPTFLVVLKGKEVIQDTYLLECMAKEMMQNWADAIYTIWGPCSIRLRLQSTLLSKTPLPDASHTPLAEMLPYVQSSQQSFYIQLDIIPEEAVAEERLMKTKEFLASWNASMDGDATWSGEIVCLGNFEEAAGYCLDANGRMQARDVSENTLQIMETNALHLPLQP